jgi:hypothetical protein
MGHPIERLTTNLGLSGLRFQQARREALSENGLCWFQPGNAYGIQRLLSSRFVPVFGWPASSHPVSTVQLSYSVLPDMGVLPGRDQDGGQAIDRLVNLAHRRFDHSGIIDTIFGQLHRFNLMAVRLNSKVLLTPGVALGFAMCTHFLFPFPIDFKPVLSITRSI